MLVSQNSFGVCVDAYDTPSRTVAVVTFQLAILAGLSLLTAFGGLITAMVWVAFLPIDAPRGVVVAARFTLMLALFALTAAAAAYALSRTPA